MVDTLGLLGNEPVGILRGRGGRVAREVEPALYLFVEIDFRGAIRVDLGVSKQRKRERVGGRATKNLCRGK